MIGEIIQFAGSVIPDGYLVCDGSEISRDTYSDLFDVIGTIYGYGDGETTFNLPDLTGKVAMGASSTYTIGSSGGEATHELTSGEMASHAHTVPSHGPQQHDAILGAYLFNMLQLRGQDETE